MTKPDIERELVRVTLELDRRLKAESEEQDQHILEVVLTAIRSGHPIVAAIREVSQPGHDFFHYEK